MHLKKFNPNHPRRLRVEGKEIEKIVYQDFTNSSRLKNTYLENVVIILHQKLLLLIQDFSTHEFVKASYLVLQLLVSFHLTIF